MPGILRGALTKKEHDGHLSCACQSMLMKESVVLFTLAFSPVRCLITLNGNPYPNAFVADYQYFNYILISGY
jgi:hypothetical protein